MNHFKTFFLFNLNFSGFHPVSCVYILVHEDYNSNKSKIDAPTTDPLLA
jgi:hypothetical protein